ncbi:hypothetical protein LEP1GSC060_0021 [Leptospira weilii serovar Ranarum str. ICFT]|uniref:Uncharacterized protein n=1 Tax=Leptospira weilii serovar Ranarum str. ICFT TaxID=1218598 RepID=N1WL31_9LEPT|nr:hypothetical protein LEP1GSC060_0021 [Leptospira weilii serovar Ranarum str. ICFT]
MGQTLKQPKRLTKDRKPTTIGGKTRRRNQPKLSDPRKYPPPFVRADIL